jgi:hypothetical protein
MTPDPYRSAYEKALAELNQIERKFEELRTRKILVENLIMALRPVSGSDHISPSSQEVASNPGPQIVSEIAAEEIPSVSAPADQYSFLEVPNPLAEGDGDPFQRRAKTSFRFKGLAAQRSY